MKFSETTPKGTPSNSSAMVFMKDGKVAIQFVEGSFGNDPQMDMFKSATIIVEESTKQATILFDM